MDGAWQHHLKHSWAPLVAPLVLDTTKSLWTNLKVVFSLCRTQLWQVGHWEQLCACKFSRCNLAWAAMIRTMWNRSASRRPSVSLSLSVLSRSGWHYLNDEKQLSDSLKSQWEAGKGWRRDAAGGQRSSQTNSKTQRFFFSKSALFFSPSLSSFLEAFYGHGICPVHRSSAQQSSCERPSRDDGKCDHADWATAHTQPHQDGHHRDRCSQSPTAFSHRSFSPILTGLHELCPF